MADLRTDFCGIELKNPIGVTACDFGGSERLLRRCAEQGIGWIIGKTVHKIDGPHRWAKTLFLFPEALRKGSGRFLDLQPDVSQQTL